MRTSPKASSGFVAHELGHASGKRMLGGTKLQLLSRRAGRPAALIGTLGQALTDPDSAATDVLRYGPAAVFAPTLAEEARATFKGLRGLARVGGKRAALRGLLYTLPAFGTYLGAAATPIIAGKLIHHVRDK